ncbi:MAG: hypothetical protein ACXVZX_03555, partial [Terriglobales bacterium]
MQRILSHSALATLVLIAGLLIDMLCFAQAKPTLGSFENGADIGEVTPPGTAQFDPVTKHYTVTSSGENIWANNDAFHFLWRKVIGDVSLTAEIAFLTTGGDPHKKAVL